MASTYKIGEAAALLNLKTYVLRFWESEFPDIAPLRTEKGQRLYTREHLALLEHIRYLLHERGLTISGARRVLAEEKAQGMEYHFTPENGVPSAVLTTGAEADLEVSGTTPGNPEEANCTQYNLPGIAAPIKQIDNMPETLDKRVAEAYSPPPDEPVRHSGVAPEDEQVLPLVAVAKAAFQAGRMSGQKNFSASAEASSGEGSPGASAREALAEELRQALKVRDGALLSLTEHSARARERMKSIVEELEGIALALRE